MDREAFIADAIAALELTAAAGNLDSSQEVGGRATSWEVRATSSELFDRLRFDYPEFTPVELQCLLSYVCDSVLGGDTAPHPVLALMLGRLGDGSAGTERDARAVGTVLSTLKDNAEEVSPSTSSSSATWQALYAIAALSAVLAAPEPIYRAHLGTISHHGMINESIWSERLVEAVTALLERAVRCARVADRGEREERVTRALTVLEGVVLGSGSRRIASVVLTMILDVSGSSASWRVKTTRTVACVVLANETLVSANLAQRTLFEAAGPAMETGGANDGDTYLWMAAGVCLEHVAWLLLTKGGEPQCLSPPKRETFTAEMLRRGGWRVFCARHAANRDDMDDVTYVSVARALVVASACSNELRAWSRRVPGYDAAWQRDERDEHAAIVSAAWRALEEKGHLDGESRHVRFLREVLDRHIRDVAKDAARAVRLLELTTRMCAVLGVSRDGVCEECGDFGRDHGDVTDRIERLRREVRRRAAEVNDGARVRADDVPDVPDVSDASGEDGAKRRAVLPEVKELRRVDRLLKDLAEVCRGGAAKSS